MQMYECSHQFFYSDASMQNKCEVASDTCTQFDLINFFKLIYCNLDGSYNSYLLLSFFMILFIFKVIQVTIEQYVAPSIQFIAQRFQLPDSVCAVTLLAVVNGTGDMVSAFVASTQTDGLQYNIGAIYGAALFVCSIVVGMVILIQKDTIKIGVKNLFRDIGIYIWASTIIIGFGIYGELNIYSSIMMLFTYAGLVVYVCLDEYLKRIRGETTEDLILRQALSNIQLTDYTEFNTLELPSSYDRIYIDQNYDKEYMQDGQERKRNYCKIMNNLIEIPIKLFLYVCLPNSAIQKHSRLRTTLFMVPASIVAYLMHTGRIFDIQYFQFVLPFTILFGVIFYFTSQDEEEPRYYLFLQFLSLYICLGCTYIATDILIDILQTIGMIFNINKTYLGLTVISIGNALPDAVTTVALAKQGQATLGIIGSYTGQLFGLLVGFGMALLRSTWKDGPIQFQLFQSGYLIENIIIFTTIGILIFTLLIVVHSSGYMSKRLGMGLVGIYLLFFMVVTISQLF